MGKVIDAKAEFDAMRLARETSMRYEDYRRIYDAIRSMSQRRHREEQELEYIEDLDLFWDDAS